MGREGQGEQEEGVWVTFRKLERGGSKAHWTGRFIYKVCTEFPFFITFSYTSFPFLNGYPTPRVLCLMEETLLLCL